MRERLYMWIVSGTVIGKVGDTWETFETTVRATTASEAAEMVSASKKAFITGVEMAAAPVD